MKKNFKLMLLNMVICLALLAGCLVGSGVIPQAGNAAVQAAVPDASYIIQGPDQARLIQLVTSYGGVVTSTLEIINGVAATLPAGTAEKIKAEPGVTNVSPNAQVGMSGDYKGIPNTDYPNVTGATVAWKNGVTGAGVSVAVLDTGITAMDGLYHNLDGKTTKIIAWKDFVSKSSSPWDPNGHGTHVAGVIANAQKGSDGDYNGMAPAANLVGVRVLDEHGYGTYERIISGIQWIVTYAKKYNIRVMNLSLNGVVTSAYWADPLNQAVTRAWAEGIVVVVAAGNKGPTPMSIGVPGNNPYVITVGAFTDHNTVNDWSDDYVTEFSSAGPTLDAFVKPDVVAPGAHIVSTMSAKSVLAANHEANWISSSYFSMSGTSQSAAVVSGIAALTISKTPTLTPNQVKFRILATALPWVDPKTNQGLYSVWQQGAGRVNAADAVLTDMQGAANARMNILDDLSGKIHYEGYSYYDQATGQFMLQGPFESSNGYVLWNGSYSALIGTYGAWSDTYGAWSDTYGAWSDTYGAWSDTYGAWSDTYGAWSDTYGAWSDTYGAWSDTYGAWSDGYLGWAGGQAAWNGSEPWFGTNYATADFISAFKLGVSPSAASASVSIDHWVEER
jgi:serine protease AprX